MSPIDKANFTPPIKRALISVSDKSGLIELARSLTSRGIEILSTGGTASALKAAGMAVIEVSEHTGFPELMDGRLKTLHPKVHGGLLAVRDKPDHVQQAAGNDIDMIDLLVVNLYPFEETLARGADDATIVENIDIGGPAMLRSAAKNHASVTVIVDPADYPRLISEIAAHSGGTTYQFRLELAQKAHARTAAYDGAISNWLGIIVDQQDQLKPETAVFPRTITLQFKKLQDLRYGENPHQTAAFYLEHGAIDASVATSRQLQGKELSFNNIADTDAALECIKEFSVSPACVIVKHANPCGVALASDLTAAYDRAYQTDPESAFGGIIAFNRQLDAETARAIVNRQFVEVIIAPDVAPDVEAIIAARKNVRLLVCGRLPSSSAKRLDFKRVTGGLLVQDADLPLFQELRVVSKRQPSESEMSDMLFACKVAKFVKSNAIVYAKHGATVGIGAGQMSRVNSSRIAVIKAEMAKLPVQGSVVASDAFFPFADGLLSAAEAGATAVIQPGGSMRDDEVIAAANEKNLAMVFTGMRHFRH